MRETGIFAEIFISCIVGPTDGQDLLANKFHVWTSY